MEHVIVRKLEHLTGSRGAPRFSYAIETRDRKGPASKHGAFEDDIVWIQLHGGLFIAKAKVTICWRGEFSRIDEIKKRTAGSPLHDVESFWSGRPRVGFAAVAELKNENWIPPFWAGPRTYGYEWIVLDDEAKCGSWLDKKEPPRGGESLKQEFESWLAAH